jgi:predicted dithiol-disulfide oxidoreductase (DUF899 family)
MCTLWIDGFNGVAGHLAQNVDLVVVAAADPGSLRRHARNRGWHNLRLLSAGDLGSEDEDGNQDSTVSVFTRRSAHQQDRALGQADDLVGRASNHQLPQLRHASGAEDDEVGPHGPRGPEDLAGHAALLRKHSPTRRHLAGAQLGHGLVDEPASLLVSLQTGEEAPRGHGGAGGQRGHNG